MVEEAEKIVIIDDDRAITRLLRETLSLEGYQCDEAESADQALDKIRNDSPALVLLDIRMPGKSGVELLSEIRASHPDIAVIMVTAVTDTNIAIQCMKEGAYDYITKPFNLEEVILSVARALEKRRLVIENRDYQQHLEQRVKEQAQKIRDSFFNAITALVHALEAKDTYSSGHSQRVTEVSVALAKELGVSPDNIEKIRLAGLVHDIGKIGVKESILNKTRTLTHREYQHIKSHPEIGERILIPIVEDKEILSIVRNHHERYDGTSYPDGLSGKQIPLGARILAVADSYDAMISRRPYRMAVSSEAALNELERCKGTQFDPEVVNAFLRTKTEQKRLLVDASIT